MSQENVETSSGVRFTVFGLGSLVAVCVTVLLFVAPSLAGRPTPGARYYALKAAGQYRAVQSDDVWLELRVSRSERRLGSVTIQLDCDTAREFDPYSRDVRLSFRGNPGATIRRDGRFELAGRNRRGRYQLSGRFVTRGYGRLRYSARMRLPLRSDRSQLCRSAEDDYQMALYRNGVPPYSGCRSQRAHTLLHTDTGRVFQQYKLRGDLHGGWTPHAFACLFAIPHRRIDLGRNEDDETVEVPRIAGTLLAYSAGETTIAGAFAQLRVVDLSGATPTRVVDATPTTDWLHDPVNWVSNLVLKSNGAIAWIVSYAGEPQVWALDANGLRQLDSGSGVVLDSLELNGSTLTWINDGTTPSATLY